MHAFTSIRATVLSAPVAVLCLVLAWCSPSAAAHPGFSATALIKIDSSGVLSLTVRHDALAFALDETPANIADQPMFDFLSAPEAVQTEGFDAGKERFRALFTLLADGKRCYIDILEAPTSAALDEWKKTHRDKALPVKLDFVARAKLPSGVRAITFKFPQVLGDVIVTVDRPGVEPVGFPLLSGEQSPEIELNSAVHASTAQPQVAPPALSFIAIVRKYLIFGFTHIIPNGLDHALFVLGLFVLSPRAKALVWQISAFTVAHTITLALTTLHIIKLPSIVIEPAIAASIAFVAIENLCTNKVKPWRPAVAFIFGLVHGMGFASALSEVGLPTGQLAAGLAAFSVGVECGHLVVLAAAFLLLGWWREKSWYRARLAIPLSLLIAAIALFWLVQRIVVR